MYFLDVVGQLVNSESIFLYFLSDIIFKIGETNQILSVFASLMVYIRMHYHAYFQIGRWHLQISVIIILTVLLGVENLVLDLCWLYFVFWLDALSFSLVLNRYLNSKLLAENRFLKVFLFLFCLVGLFCYRWEAQTGNFRFVLKQLFCLVTTKLDCFLNWNLLFQIWWQFFFSNTLLKHLR